MDALGVEKSEVESVVRKGLKWREKDRHVWHANMGGIEAVFEKNEGGIVVVTVYYAGREK